MKDPTKHVCRVNRLRHHRLYEDVFKRYARRRGLRPVHVGEVAQYAMHLSDARIVAAGSDDMRGPWLMLVPIEKKEGEQV